jgi:16S rRNA pseudouridine516 synthase
MRLDRYLAQAGLGSRKEVKGMIRDCQVQVAGDVVCDPGFTVDELASPAVLCQGQPVVWQRHYHLMLNKPAGYLTALRDTKAPVVAELIPERCRAARLFPVGRLDKDATGLLLLTSDGTLGHRLASPRWEVWKTYRVDFSGPVFAEADVRDFAAGLDLGQGLRCRPAILTVVSESQVLLSIHEGKYHQVKRMLLATGRRVTALHRARVGPLELDSRLEPGACRELNSKEIAALYRLVDLDLK